MTILTCPRCRQHRLVSTGAFWACDACGYAITQAALFAERVEAHTKPPNKTPVG